MSIVVFLKHVTLKLSSKITWLYLTSARFMVVDSQTIDKSYLIEIDVNLCKVM